MPERDEHELGHPPVHADALDERDQRHDPALAVVVGAHDQRTYLIETISVTAQNTSEITP